MEFNLEGNLAEQYKTHKSSSKANLPGLPLQDLTSLSIMLTSTT